MGTERETVTAMIRTLVVFPHMRVMPSALHPGFRPSDMQSWCEALPIGAIRGVATSRALTAPLFKTRRLVCRGEFPFFRRGVPLTMYLGTPLREIRESTHVLGRRKLNLNVAEWSPPGFPAWISHPLPFSRNSGPPPH